jgi:RNA polymerase sigma-70 factor, ECF subfamily
MMSETSAKFEVRRLPSHPDQASSLSSASCAGASAVQLEELFRRYEQRLGRFLAQVVSNRWLAEDLMQETFLTAVRERGRLAEIENPEAWLFAIARNHALHALRRRRRAWGAIRRLAHERKKSEPDPADAAAVRDYLARHLPPEDRILLVLRYVHGFDSAELGHIVGRSPEAVRQQLSRARRSLLDQLERSPSPVDGATTDDQEVSNEER